jgi:hypothetical protein
MYYICILSFDEFRGFAIFTGLNDPLL